MNIKGESWGGREEGRMAGEDRMGKKIYSEKKVRAENMCWETREKGKSDIEGDG